jgi:hypothetical protein
MTTTHADRQTLTAELERLALSTVSLDDDGALDTAIPVPLAQRLCAALEALHVEASWAPDHDDRELAWVYVRSRVPGAMDALCAATDVQP